MTENAINVKLLKQCAQEWADAELRKESEKDLQSSIVETSSEKLDMDKAKFREYASLYFMREYKPEKFLKQEEKLESVEIVKGL